MSAYNKFQARSIISNLVIYNMRYSFLSNIIFFLQSCRTYKSVSNEDYLQECIIKNCPEYTQYLKLNECRKIAFLDSLHDKKGLWLQLKGLEECFTLMVSSLFNWETDSTNMSVYGIQYYYSNDSLYSLDMTRLRAKYRCSE